MACSIEIDPLESDLFVAAQIFGHKEYGLEALPADRLSACASELRAAGRIPVIIDGGANVGYSALYFASQFPDALVVALEPDATSFDALLRNCAGNSQIVARHAALWSHGDGVRLQATENGSWAHFVSTDGDLTPSVTLHSLFEDNPAWSPLVIKLDIEGGEKAVLAASPGVFQTAMCIMIEPHDFKFRGEACLTPLFRALADRPMDTLISGENLILLDPKLTRQGTPLRA